MPLSKREAFPPWTRPNHNEELSLCLTLSDSEHARKALSATGSGSRDDSKALRLDESRSVVGTSSVAASYPKGATHELPLKVVRLCADRRRVYDGTQR